MVNAGCELAYLSLCDGPIRWVPDHKYVGVLLNTCTFFKDDGAIKRQMMCINGKGNALIRKFKHSSPEVKTRLFESYCTNRFCAELWNDYKVKSLNQLKVAYNNVFRHLLLVKRSS